jgi:hypothetical protein
LASLRLHAAGRWNRRRPGPAPCTSFSRAVERRRLRSTESTTDVSQPARDYFDSSRTQRDCATASGGAQRPTRPQCGPRNTG